MVSRNLDILVTVNSEEQQTRKQKKVKIRALVVFFFFKRGDCVRLNLKKLRVKYGSLLY